MQDNRERAVSDSSLRRKGGSNIKHDTQLREELLPELITTEDKVSKSSSGKENEQFPEPTVLEKIREYLLQTVQKKPRTVRLSGQCTPTNYQNNLVKNTKYNIVSFVPLVLFNQFKFFFNMFFLIIALTQLIELLRVGLFITYIGPLVMVLSLTMGKEAYDDYRTYLRDIQANSKVYDVLRKPDSSNLRDMEANSKVSDTLRKKTVTKLASKQLKVGDLVVVRSGDRIPADMIILYSDNEQGTLFLKTDQLDGETDWKLRKAVKFTQSLVTETNDLNCLLSEEYCCRVKEPIGQIYNFEGVFTADAQNEVRQKLSLENTMWTSTVLTNGEVVGLVSYIGNQTRVAMGARTPRTKVGILDMEINFLSKVLFLIMVGLTMMLLLLQFPQWKYWPIQFTRILILLSSIIPISMRVNLDFAKLFYAFQIGRDSDMKGTITRNSNCPEQLGRIKYILSDKTGTLTQNEMLFKTISIEDRVKFNEDNLQEIKCILSSYEDITEKKVCKEKYLKEIVTALALCHNVTPVYNEEGENKQKSESESVEDKQKNEFESVEDKQKSESESVEEQVTSSFASRKSFQASSPDQITFVKIVESFGIELESRTQTEICLKLPSGRSVKYQILYTFPFSSETKRMGILLRNEYTKQITFYLKGADSVMKNFVLNKQKQGFIEEECRDLSMTGLRTLVITKKELKQEHYEKWAQQYEKAYNQLEVDHKELERLMDELEAGVEFLGVTGIEDKLQNELKPTIESLQSAGIRIWMITGDKCETAECIGRSCGLQKITEENVKVEEVDNLQEWRNKWEKVKQNLERVLIIDGKTLTYVLEASGDQQIAKDFYLTAMQMLTVICCRCSPQQKRILTEGVKRNRKKKESVLGIGDGGNDVGMIQAADIGVGIVGKEGKQAALAADFSILEFKHLKGLLLWHGRLSYKRSSLLASFIIHRGFIISVIQVIFSCVFFYVSIPVFNSILQLGFATIFTFWPVFSLILDTDIDKKRALMYPALYASLQSSELLSIRIFMSWIWKASFQGAIIIILPLLLFGKQSYLEVETLCFSVMILTEYCMTLSEIHRIHILTLGCNFLSLACYSICVFWLREYIHVSGLTIEQLGAICLITALSWLPLLIYKVVHRKIYPSDYEKVMLNVKRSLIARRMFRTSSEVMS